MKRVEKMNVPLVKCAVCEKALRFCPKRDWEKRRACKKHVNEFYRLRCPNCDEMICKIYRVGKRVINDGNKQYFVSVNNAGVPYDWCKKCGYYRSYA